MKATILILMMICFYWQPSHGNVNHQFAHFLKGDNKVNDADILQIYQEYLSTVKGKKSLMLTLTWRSSVLLEIMSEK